MGWGGAKVFVISPTPCQRNAYQGGVLKSYTLLNRTLDISSRLFSSLRFGFFAVTNQTI